jgi:Fe-Mn family superoxide dismutase
MAVATATLALPKLPYALEALAPHMSRETLEFHHGKHHKAYVDKVNQLVEGTEHDGQSLEEIIADASGPLFDNAAQAWNHSFFWHCLTPDPRAPGKDLEKMLNGAFGSLEKFQAEFTRAALGVFGSGWAWLVKDVEGVLRVVTTRNAGLPMVNNQVALLTCDVWEHAYYLDRRNDRGAYLKHFWPIVNWEFVAQNLVSGWESTTNRVGL